MDDFYTEFLQELPLDEWGHPVLPMPEKLGRKEYSRASSSCRSSW